MSVIALALISFVLTFCAMLVLIRLAPRLDLVDYPSQRKHHNAPTPAVGGLALYLMMMALFMSGVATSEYTLPLMIAATLVTFAGAFDDQRHISPYARLLVHFVAALIMVYGAGVRLETFGAIGPAGGQIMLGPFSATITIFGIMSVVNAMNFIDGLDGLAGGISLIAVTGLWIIFAISGHAIPNLVPMMAGGLAAFLFLNIRWFRRKSAALFLGDAGSTLLGMLLALLMIEHSQGNSKIISPVVALWLLAIPLIDFLAIVIRRIAMGRHPFCPDHEHLHHILARATKSEMRSVAIILVIAFVLAAVGILGIVNDWPENVMFYAFLTIFALGVLAVKQSWKASRFVKANDARG